MDVSIIIPTKNGGQILDKVLARLTSQKTKYSYEIICVDSGSKDNSIETIKKYDSCRLFEIPSHEFGHGKTRNYGASKGTGEYIMFITQDALPCDENWIENFIDAMKVDNQIVGGFGKHYPYPDCNIFDRRDIEGLFEGFGSENRIFYMEDKDRYIADEGYRHLLAFYSDNNSCMKREIWEQYPYSDVNFAEDQIWAKQMIELGFKKIYCPSAGVFHSHNYKLTTYFSRYYDEYKGLYELHSYRIATTRRSMMRRCLKHIQSEWKYVNTLNLDLKKKWKWKYYSFVRNHFRYFAGYLGGKYHLCSKKRQDKLDQRYSQQFRQINK